MARKRGGIAGIYDRNKGLVRTIASLGAGALGGPLAGAAVGAAFRGLDREGKSGIGFDPFAALPGAVEGYMTGQAGQSLRGGVSNVKNMLMGRGAAPGASLAGAPVGPGGYQVGFQGIGMPLDSASPVGAGIPDLPAFGTKVGMTPGFGASQAAIGAPSVGAMPNILKPVVPPKGFMEKAGDIASATLKGARENKDLIAMAGKGILESQTNPALAAQARAAEMNAQTNRMAFEDEQRRARMEEERKQRIAELLMPYIQQNYGSLFPRQG